MVPTYRPNETYLRQSLESVLQQAPGSEQMQIEVVDDCSPGMDVAALVKSIVGERVQFSRTPENLGLAGCWNTCIERSRGDWVHILHQDDWVLPQFYGRFEALIQRKPEIDAAFSRHLYADADGHWTGVSPLEMREAGELKGFDSKISVWQRIECPAVIVKRSTYARLGGFRKGLPYLLDWEMWCRIAAKGRWAYVPEPGAVHRRHPMSETQRLLNANKTVEDFLIGGRIARAHFSQELQARTARSFHNKLAHYGLDAATALFVKESLKDAARLLDSLREVFMRSQYRRDWICLRFRVLIKTIRSLGFHG